MLASSLPEARRAHRIAVSLGDPRYQVLTLGQLANALAAVGDHEEALLHHWASIDLAKREDDVLGQATGLNNVAQVEQTLGRREIAAAHQFQAMEIYHRAGDERAYVLAVNNLAELYVELGRLGEAEDYARQGVDLAHAGAMPFEEAFGRQVLGAVLARRAERAAAQAELTESLRLFEQVGSPRAVLVRTALEVLTSEV
jgi:tetratricopeptide (TPR) repeat protein